MPELFGVENGSAPLRSQLLGNDKCVPENLPQRDLLVLLGAEEEQVPFWRRGRGCLQRGVPSPILPAPEASVQTESCFLTCRHGPGPCGLEHVGYGGSGFHVFGMQFAVSPLVRC